MAELIVARRSGAVPSLSSDSEAYLGWLGDERGRASNTLSAYRRDLVAYERWLSARDLDLRHVTGHDVGAYVEHLRGAGRRPSSVARALSAVRSLHRFMTEGGVVVTDPTGDIAAPRPRRDPPVTLTEAEVASLLSSVEGRGPCERRDRALLELLYGTGMRISEAVGLSIGDFDRGRGSVLIDGAGARARVVPLGGGALEALERWLAAPGRAALAGVGRARRSDVDAVFVNSRGGRLTRQGAWGVIGHRGEAAGLVVVLTPHLLRQSCAAHMIDRGADPKIVQELLGHAPASGRRPAVSSGAGTIGAGASGAGPVATGGPSTAGPAPRLRSVYEATHPRAGVSPPVKGPPGC